ncbi:MAG: tRNA (guanine(10)-N(2))-dimethyltransferase [Candidatus Altiarchaeales archaeon WOR_SM1_86-2]|nr:MAG: tRNA (guanine(10)-N(2))-dimethyltransferase [Candidatus Altiarchaeales archaeon WOR_SM1_86-2]ODS41661.1 MAG: tRNA (guanine(10)-N(2))-dimethyltransferase [Candidatus Altiarchaeales archaeon WOR_SM1_79]
MKTVTEGETKLMVPVEEKLSRKSTVFFNPKMELSRDISVAVAGLLKPHRVCDALAGCGARGIRMLNECGYGMDMTINDINPYAYKLIKKNAALNLKEKVTITNLDSNVLLGVDYEHGAERYDYVDIDPFGTPVRFIEPALRALNNNAILAVTATDTAPLCGTYPKACRRKYDAVSLKTDYYDESGLRILIAYLARLATKYNIGVTPLFSHSTLHYFRTYLQIHKIRSNRYVNEAIENVKYIQHCFNCFRREFRDLDELESFCECGEKYKTAGPLWAGDFADAKFCDKLGEKLSEKKEAIKLVELINLETDPGIRIPYYDVHKICKSSGISIPTMDKIMETLKENGFKAARTHFSGVGLRTDAPADKLVGVILGF